MYIEYLKKDDIFSRACRVGLRIKNGKVIINLFAEDSEKLNGFEISEDEKQFVSFTDIR